MSCCANTQPLGVACSPFAVPRNPRDVLPATYCAVNLRRACGPFSYMLSWRHRTNQITPPAGPSLFYVKHTRGPCAFALQTVRFKDGHEFASTVLVFSSILYLFVPLPPPPWRGLVGLVVIGFGCRLSCVITDADLLRRRQIARPSSRRARYFSCALSTPAHAATVRHHRAMS